MPFVSFLLVTVFAFNVFAADIPDFLKNPFAATITSTLVMPESNSSFVRSSVTILPSRKSTPLMERVANFNYNYRLRSDNTAPLVFIIPGTGGTAESAAALVLAEQLFKTGYHVVTVDNPFSWKFSVAGSKTGLPGYTPRDAADLYKAFAKVSKELRVNNGITPRSYSLVGYSLGGLQSLFVKKQDDQARLFNFKKVLVINPPANLLYAVQKLDRLASLEQSLSFNQKQNISFKVTRVTDLVTGGKINLKNPLEIDRVFKEEAFSNLEMQYLIGSEFRNSLGDLVFASQQVKDLGILKSPATKYKRNARNAEAAAVSFARYLNEFLLPSVRQSEGASYSVQQMNHDASIFQFADYIRDNESLYFIDSADDLFSKSEDIAWMKSQFGSRGLVLPIGGHCGFFQLPAFQQRLNQIFKF
ncbi:alpha/beta hydrolase [Bdellovibrio sp. SKB1291214]|uniref:alpha/beta fold hydrolase n=1 Tax=Bdellovibrio sp. SKB1291214 TaxID=1732569 RepID=UPI000B51A9E6|nr:alpha/beta hydrolase [Bdellovibrio sp. SKB1291214]UYL07398.1 alpha/beta hydrolase [Bdellovibrio sp. SKB1291214]